MFDIAWSELLVVAIVALVVIGPKELPGLLRTLGRTVGVLRRHAEEFRRQFDESVREAGGEDLKREIDQLRTNNPLSQIRNTIEDAAREVTHPPLTFESPSPPPATSAEPVAAAPVVTETVAPASTQAQPAPVAEPAPSDNANAPAQPHVNGAGRP